MLTHRSFHLLLWLVVLSLFSGCDQGVGLPPTPDPDPIALAVVPTVDIVVSSPTDVVIPPTPLPAHPTEEPATPEPLVSPTPLFAGDHSPACGLLLPPLPGSPTPDANPVPLASGETAASLLAAAPAAARPALSHLLQHPEDVGLVAYELGNPAGGVYVNATSPMPLASLVKLIHLVAYVEAVAAGQLDPLERVPLAEIDRFYLPSFDLGAHRRAVNELREEGRIVGEANPSLLLEDIPRMMIRHSSNAASDYLQARLGQERLEATALEIGLTSQSAPCSFLGQFLMMANHTRLATDMGTLQAYLDDGEEGAIAYGRDVALLADAYFQSELFRTQEVDWRRSTRRPSNTTQRFFTEQFNPQATAADYGALMARLAMNGLSTPDSSFQARRYLEWPMVFPVNQELFTNLGYKNGSLPGVLTTAYYAYRQSDGAPVVVVLLYRDLPQQTYRQWRFALPHDEFARWLLADPGAIPLLARAFASGA